MSVLRKALTEASAFLDEVWEGPVIEAHGELRRVRGVVEKALRTGDAEPTGRDKVVADFVAQREEYVSVLRQCVNADDDYYRWQGHAEARRQLRDKLAALPDAVDTAPPTAISGADIKPGMTILLTPGSKPFRVDGVEPFNKSESTFVLTSGVPHSETGQLAYGDRWYCLLGGGA